MTLIIDGTIMMKNVVVQILREFIEEEARSCSMDYGCITPLYIYRMWGGAISYEDIQAGLAQIRAER